MGGGSGEAGAGRGAAPPAAAREASGRGPLRPRGRGEDERGAVLASLLDAALTLAALALLGLLLHYVAVLPNARRAERLERRGHALEREVTATAAEVERLRREVLALQSDPYTIERAWKRRWRELRPDRFGPDGAPLPPPAGDAAAPARPPR
jgi:hypothetical protein